MVFLHGASARGTDCAALKSNALPRHLDGDCGGSSLARAFPGLLLSPLCPAGANSEWRNQAMCDAIMEMIDLVVERFALDGRRVYLTGVSMGGLGAWMLAARNCNPARFAAVAPMCGGGSTVYARLLKDTPMWFVHAVDDNVIAVEETDRLVAALRDVAAVDVNFDRYEGGKVHETADAQPREHPAETPVGGEGAVDQKEVTSGGRDAARATGPRCDWMVGHNCWDRAYANQALWDWMFSKSLPEPHR